MKKLFLIIILLSCHLVSAEVNYNFNNCQKEMPNESKIKMEDMGWKQTAKVMAEKFSKIYNSGKRLQYRAFLDNDKFVLPTKYGAKVHIGSRFINSVRAHIETALTRKYVDYIFFSDMGHSHLFVDKEVYNKQIDPLENSQVKERYEIMLNDKKTKFLYHTAEQLALLDENKQPINVREILWRFFSRNIVGDNLQTKKLELIYAKEHVKNTAKLGTYASRKDYFYWGAGYSISASKEGCFEYIHKGKKFYFDISLYDVEYASMSDDSP